MLDDTTERKQKAQLQETLPGKANGNPALQEALDALGRLNNLDPEHPRSSHIAYKASRQLLRHEPFLAYQGENERIYWVWSRLGLSLLLPKNRQPSPAHPKKEPGPLDPAHRALAAALLGILLGGLGALILAPLAIWRSLGIFRSPASPQPDRIRAGMVMLLATLLWAAAAVLGFLFLLHVLG